MFLDYSVVKVHTWKNFDVAQQLYCSLCKDPQQNVPGYGSFFHQ